MAAIKPYKHQLKTVKFLAPRPRALDLSDPGTGKTYSEILDFVAARKKGGKCALVIAPKSLLRAAWEEDFKKFAPHIKCSVAEAENRAEAFATDADVYITNTDASTWLVKQKPTFFKKFDRLIIDEISMYKHPTSQRSKAMNKIKKYFSVRRGMGGTPNANRISDVWHQAFLIDDGKRLGTSFFAFRAAVCEPIQTGPKPNMVEWVDKEGAEQAVAALLMDITIRHKFEDCIDIPENFIYTVPYKLAPKQMKIYKDMENVALAEMDDETLLTATNAASVRTKLLQIASGAVYQGRTSKLVDTGRYELVLDLVEQAKHSLVFFLWKHQRDELIKEATARKLKYCIYDGDTTDKDRSELVRDYQAGFYDVMFAHPASAGHGLTLTRGTRTIWASPTDNLELFAQGNRRIPRAGQKQKTETIVVIDKDTIELRVFNRLTTKSDRMNNLLTMLEA